MWESCLIELVRILINDVDCLKYDDNRILLLIKSAAYYVTSDLSCCPNIQKPSISNCGDFEDNPLEFPEFTNLLILRAACIVDQGELRSKAAAEGLKAVCGPVSMQVLSGSGSFGLLFSEGACAAYKNLKDDLCFRCPIQSASCCQQIISMGVESRWCY